VDAIRFASQPLADLLRSFATPGHNGPLYHLLLHPWLEVAGSSEFALRFFSVFWGVLAVPLAYRLARRLFPALTSLALVAALLVVTSPYLVWYGQEGKMYAFVATLVLLSVERLVAAVERGGWPRWLAYVLVTAPLPYVHLVAALIVPAQAVAVWVHRGRTGLGHWWPWLASLAALALPYVALLIWLVPLLLEGANTGYRFLPLHEMLFSLWRSYSHGVVEGTPQWTLALPGTLLLAAALLRSGSRRRRASLVLLACWLLVPPLGFFVITLLRPLYAARYLIFVVPAYLILLSAGVVALAQRSRLLAGLLLVALLLLNARGVWFQARIPLKADFRAATRYVKDRLDPTDLILFQIPYGRHTFEYYYRCSGTPTPRQEGRVQVTLPWLARSEGSLFRWAEGPYTNAGMPDQEVERRMVEITGSSHVVWLIASEVPLWDERGQVQAWLEQQAKRTREARFVRVTVYRYELR
jgi:4-amino-4-deoxy-L-arabinose transferase-like glycosyltransferase